MCSIGFPRLFCILGLFLSGPFQALPAHAKDAQQADTLPSGSYLEMLHTFDSLPAAGHAYSAYHGKEVAYFEGAELVGRDPVSGTIKWRSEGVGPIRKAWEVDTRVLVASEHLRMLDATTGKTLWTYPLNCQPDNCASDVLVVGDSNALVAGFAPQFNMLMLLDLNGGRGAWSSWATTCPMQQAGVAGERVFVLCTNQPTAGSPGAQGTATPASPAVAQVLDLKTRRLVATLSSPEPGFVAETGWYSSSHAYILGSLGGTRKLVVFDASTGAPLMKYTVKQDGGGPGFFVSPEASRFVSWQITDATLALWGMDGPTGKVAWNIKLKGAEVVGQAGSTLVVTRRSRGQFKLVGLDLVSGETLFERLLPHKSPTFKLQRHNVLIYGAGDRLFMALDATTGVVLAVTQLAHPPAALEPTAVCFTSTAENATLRLGNEISLHVRKPFGRWLDSMIAALDSGNELLAGQLLAPLEPFAEVAPEVNTARRSLALFQLLNAEMKLRRKQGAAALVDAGKATEWAGRFTLDDVKILGPALMRFWSQCAWLCPPKGQRDEFLFDALMLLHARPGDWGPASDVVGMAVLLVRTIKDSDFREEARNILQEMHAKKELATAMEQHPYWLQFRFNDLELLLEEAKIQVKQADFLLAAQALHKLAENPTANTAFESEGETWLDAQSAYLLPAELLEERVPPLVLKLDRSLAKARRKVLAEAEKRICQETCRTTGVACHSKCVPPEACLKSIEACVDGCRHQKSSWLLPDFSASPLSPTFFKCR